MFCFTIPHPAGSVHPKDACLFSFPLEQPRVIRRLQMHLKRGPSPRPGHSRLGVCGVGRRKRKGLEVQLQRVGQEEADLAYDVETSKRPWAPSTPVTGRQGLCSERHSFFDSSARWAGSSQSQNLLTGCHILPGEWGKEGHGEERERSRKSMFGLESISGQREHGPVQGEWGEVA